jgi:GTP pyrophosphokinase
MFSGDVVKAVYPDFKEERKAAAAHRPDPGWFKMRKAAGMQFKAPGATGPALPIRGLRGDLPVSFAPDGGAVPGDRIVGILTPGEGVTIYPIQSSALANFDDQPERWLDVRWDMEGAPELFPAKIVVAAINEPGSLGAVAHLIGEAGANIDEVEFNKISPDFREMIFEIEVFDLKHLTDIVSKIRALPMVNRVERVIG